MEHRNKPERVGNIANAILEKWKRRGTEKEKSLFHEAKPEEPRKVRDPDNDFSKTVSIQNEEEELNLPLDHFDFDLAEFPLFRLYKNRLSTHDRNESLSYTDVIAGKGGEKITREWKVYAGQFGFGGQSTQSLLYDLFQLYVEQGAQERFIHFGTLTNLLSRQGIHDPSARDYARVKRDIAILLDYRFHAKNAFWDSKHQVYIDMQWHLFASVFYPNERRKSKINPFQLSFPLGMIEVSSVLQQIGRTRGFFALGFNSQFFHSLKPLEQRLAVYLSKKFSSQKIHQRFVDDLAKALPIEASRKDNTRMILKRAAEGLLKKGFSLLESFHYEKARDGRYLAVFYRKARPKRDFPLPVAAAKELAPTVLALMNEIINTTGDEKGRHWWIRCAEKLGPDGVYRALGQFKETCQIRKVKNRGAMMTKILQDIAKERGITIQ